MTPGYSFPFVSHHHPLLQIKISYLQTMLKFKILAGARRIRENQKPPNSQNKNRQIAEPRLQILESIKNRFSEYILYSVHENIEIVSSMVYSSKIVAFCWIIDIFNFVQFCVLVDFCVFQLKRRNVVVRSSVDFFRLKSQYS